MAQSLSTPRPSIRARGRPLRLAALLVCLGLVVAACGVDSGNAPAGSGSPGSGSQGSGGPSGATGPIKIWYSNNAEEVTWGKAVVAAWNKANPDQQVTGEEIPAGKSSEEVIGAAITAGNTPCLVFNTSPAAVPQFQKQGGLVALDTFPDGVSYIQARSGSVADQYKFTDGKFYQMPWKMNPVMIFYNKDVFTKAGIPTDKPPLSTYADFLATAQTLVVKGRRAGGHLAVADLRVLSAVVRLLSAVRGRDRRQGPDRERRPAVQPNRQDSTSRISGRRLYSQKLAPQEPYQGDSFADGKAAMAIVGPWAIAVYGKQGELGSRAGPDQGRHGREQDVTPSATRNRSACTPAARTSVRPGVS